MAETGEFHFSPQEGASPLYGRVWSPENGVICGLVQLVHGLNDRVDRYDRFARRLADRGFLVFGEDHLGQGKSARRARQLGYTAPSGGWHLMSEAVYSLGKQAQARHPGQKWFVVGHSMGSLLARTCLIDHPDAFDGCVFTGTNSPPVPALESLLERCREEERRIGPTGRSRELAALIFTDVLHFDPAADAMTEDGKIDLLCSFIPTVRLFEDFFEGLLYLRQREAEGYAHPPVPLLLLSGAEDPTNGQGRGMLQTAERFTELGFPEVETRLLEGLRHELLNGPGGEPVQALVEEWLIKISN
ncbi:MAG: alpha/beta hydrolase [Clostridiales bacterium]|nr:alpha/beta hydrolase [Clostridiales bacterium]